MATGAEPIAAEQFLFAAISAVPSVTSVAGGRVYQGAAPPTAAFPSVIFAMIGAGSDTLTVDANTVYADPLYKVVVAHKADSVVGIATLVADIHAALHKRSGDVAAGRVVACTRERPFRLTTFEQNVRFQQIGGEYRVLVAG